MDESLIPKPEEADDGEDKDDDGKCLVLILHLIAFRKLFFPLSFKYIIRIYKL